jgi:anti-anti-sigma factor
MTIATIGARHGECTCGGARIRAHCRHLATVVTIRGEVDAVNIGQLGEHLRHFLLGDNPVVLDMSDVQRFAAQAISLLSMLDEQCAAAGLEWALVASPAVADALNEHDGAEITVPIARSVHEALHDLADAIASRRQLMLQLVRKTA